MGQMERMINSVANYYDRKGYHYTRPSDSKIRIKFSLDSKVSSVEINLSFSETGVMSYASIAMKADESSRMAVMEYITRANYRMKIGNFDMDLSDGEVCFRVYIDYDDLDSLSDSVISGLTIFPSNAFERYGNGLLILMMGLSDPETEIEKIQD